MNAVRVLFLTLVFALSMLFLVQNTQVLDTRAGLILDLWWVELSSPEIAFYVFIFLCLIFGIIFGAVTFFPGNRELRAKLRLLRIRIKSLTQEVIAMHKKDETPQEPERTQEPKPLEEPDSVHEKSDLPQGPYQEDVVIKTGGAAGKAALVGVFAIFVLLTAFYYYVDQKISDFQAQMDLTIESSTQAAELAQRIEQETKGFNRDIAGLTRSLQKHEKEISALQSLPQDTMNYLTMMLISEYAVKVDGLLEKAETEEDREMLSGVLDSLGKALEHYRKKVE